MSARPGRTCSKFARRASLPNVKDADGNQVSGALLRLGVFTVIVVCLGVAGLLYGLALGGGHGVVIVVLAAGALAAIVVMWSAVVVTQWRRRNLGSPR